MTRVAFIGAGNRSISHMAALSHIPNTEVVGIADLDESRIHDSQQRANERRNPAADPIQASSFTDWRDMVDTVQPDCLYLCLPPFVHGDLDHQIIDVGKPILFEKPVGLDMTVVPRDRRPCEPGQHYQCGWLSETLQFSGPDSSPDAQGYSHRHGDLHPAE